MDQRLKEYLKKCGRATLDESVVKDLRRLMEQAVPRIVKSIRQREELAAELRISSSRRTESKSERRD